MNDRRAFRRTARAAITVLAAAVALSFFVAVEPAGATGGHSSYNPPTVNVSSTCTHVTVTSTKYITKVWVLYANFTVKEFSGLNTKSYTFAQLPNSPAVFIIVKVNGVYVPKYVPWPHGCNFYDKCDDKDDHHDGYKTSTYGGSHDECDRDEKWLKSYLLSGSNKPLAESATDTLTSGGSDVATQSARAGIALLACVIGLVLVANRRTSRSLRRG
jgi:hypothetical protein